MYDDNDNIENAAIPNGGNAATETCAAVAIDSKTRPYEQSSK
jgi:hypothetical protein